MSYWLALRAFRGLSATAVRARAGAPRMDLELGDMDAASPSRARGSHGVYASFQIEEGTRVLLSACVMLEQLKCSLAGTFKAFTTLRNHIADDTGKVAKTHFHAVVRYHST